jgi:hypothetical protein
MDLTPEDVKKVIDERLASAGLESVLNKGLERVLAFPEGCFVEIVLQNADRLSEVENVVESIREEFQRHGVRIQAIVRSIWRISSVKYQEVSRSPEGTPRAALQFAAKLISGSRECQVYVHVSMSALGVLRRKLSKDDAKLTLGWTPAKGDLDEDTISVAVRCFLEECLSSGGEGFWDPIRYPNQELGETAMSMLLGESRAFVVLRQGMDDAFEPPVLTSFLKSLGMRSTRAIEFDDVLPEISNVFGGAFERGEVFSTSSTELYSHLRESEKSLLRHYYTKKVNALLQRFPHLVDEFPQLF